MSTPTLGPPQRTNSVSSDPAGTPRAVLPASDQPSSVVHESMPSLDCTETPQHAYRSSLDDAGGDIPDGDEPSRISRTTMHPAHTHEEPIILYSAIALTVFVAGLTAMLSIWVPWLDKSTLTCIGLVSILAYISWKHVLLPQIQPSRDSTAYSEDDEEDLPATLFIMVAVATGCLLGALFSDAARIYALGHPAKRTITG